MTTIKGCYYQNKHALADYTVFTFNNMSLHKTCIGVLIILENEWHGQVGFNYQQHWTFLLHYLVYNRYRADPKFHTNSRGSSPGAMVITA
jgi:hypothetical protein